MTKRKSLTKEYLNTLKDVYNEEGLLAAMVYEIKSTFISMTNGLANIFEPHMRNPEYLSGRRWPEGSVGAYEKTQADWNMENRDKATRAYLLRGKKRPLEKTLSITSILGFLGALFFLSFSMTGNVIGNAAQSTVNWIGVTLFIIGVIAAFTYFRTK